VQFTLAGISNEKIKFYHVISQLDLQYAADVEDIITSPPQQEPYTKLKTELVNRSYPLRDKRAHQLITLEEMGDRKPSQPEAPQKSGTGQSRLLTAHSLDQPFTHQHPNHSRRYARGRAGRCGPPHRSHH
jgi:hypothetical protein